MPTGSGPVGGGVLRRCGKCANCRLPWLGRRCEGVRGTAPYSVHSISIIVLDENSFTRSSTFQNSARSFPMLCLAAPPIFCFIPVMTG